MLLVGTATLYYSIAAGKAENDHQYSINPYPVIHALLILRLIKLNQLLGAKAHSPIDIRYTEALFFRSKPC